MKTYTVILINPEAHQDNEGLSTFKIVASSSPENAARSAQLLVADELRNTNPNDFKVIAVFIGDQYPELTFEDL